MTTGWLRRLRRAAQLHVASEPGREHTEADEEPDPAVARTKVAAPRLHAAVDASQAPCRVGPEELPSTPLAGGTTRPCPSELHLRASRALEVVAHEVADRA